MSSPAPARVRVEIEVRYAETDAMGVVHHSRYLPWFEIARTRLCSESGHHYADIERMGYQLVVTQVELSYRRGARYGDFVAVTCSLEEVASRKLRFAYEVTRGDQLLVTGTTEHIWVTAATGKPCRPPRELAEKFEQLGRG